MSAAEDRVVNMRFNNADFKKAAVDTQKSLADVNKAVDAAGKTRGLMDLSSQMDAVQVSASKMSIVTTAALATISAKATSVALATASALTLDPIKQGFTEYEALLTKQNTIMNATGQSATVVKGYLNALNTYSDKTIYSFGDMTDSIQKFVNAGISLPQSVQSIKGVANMAAFAGASAQEASRGMYAFSQSMGTGYLMLNDWMQIENANMGTVQFKQTLIDSAEALGELTKKGDMWETKSGTLISATKGWRDGLQDQWATTNVLNDALSKYTDQSTKLGREAQQSAQEVRTFSAFMDTLKESIGSGWSQVFTGLFGGLDQATTMWTGMSLAIGNVVGKFFQFAAGSLRVWRNMGGAEKVLQGFKNILSPIGALLGAIGAAWREAFPRSGRGAGEGLYGLSVAFEAVTRPLQLLAKLISGTTPFLAAFFTVVRLGATVLGNIGGLIADFVTSLLGLSDFKPGSSGILDFAKKIANAIADAAAQVQKLLDKGASLKEAFGSVSISLPNMPSMPDMPSLPSLPSLPSIGGGSEAEDGVSGLTSKVKELTGATKELGETSKDSASTGIFDFGSMLSGIGSFLGKMKDGIANLLSNFSWTDAVSAFNTAIFATMGFQIITVLNTIKKAFKGIEQIANFKEGILDNVTASVKAFQMQARAALILNIAIALLLLAGALFILSKIPADKLATGLAAVGAMAVIMSKAMKSMTESITKMDGAKTGVKMIGISVAIVALAFAMILLATAFVIFNHVDLESVVKGVAVMFVAMKLIENLGNLSAEAYKNLLGGAVAITAVAGAMILLAAALLLFKLVDWESMGKAGAALAGLTIAVAALAMIPYEGIAKVGAAMLLASLGLDAMALALIAFALVKWESIGKAVVVLAALAIALAVIMAVGGPGGAATILALGVAMVFLAGSLLMLNDVEWASIAKMAVIFTVLSVALLALTGILYLMAPVIPVMVLFGLALLAMGVGMLAFAGAMALAISLGAAGVAAFAALATGAAVAVAVFLQTLAAEAPVMKNAFLAILQELINTIVEAVPMIIDGVQRLWAAIKKEFDGGAKKAGGKKAGSSMIQDLGDSIKAKLPLIVDKAKEIIVGFIKGLISKAPAIAAAGVQLLIGLIKGVASKAGDLVDAAVDLIIKFAKGIANGYSKILQAGVHLIADFLHALADTIRSSSGLIGSGIKDVIDALRDVGVDMVKGIIAGVTSMIGDATSAIGGLASSMLDKAKSILKINSPSKEFMKIGGSITEGLAKGVAATGGAAIVAVASLMQGTIATANEYLSGFIQDMDLKAEVLRGKADGLAKAAQAAASAASKTKTKADDRAAKKLQNKADRAAAAAQAAENKAENAAAAQDRAEEFENASLIEKAQIRSQDAQNQIEAAKAAKGEAAEQRAQAAALDKQSKKAGVTAKQAKAMKKQADDLRAAAKANDQRAKELMAAASGSAASALDFQRLAGDELAKAFQSKFDEEAQADADEAAFEVMSSADKALKRREQAAKLDAAAQQALADAKVLAYTDVEAANEKAQLALELADQARQYLDEAMDYEGQGATATGGPARVVDLAATEAAAMAFNKYSATYDAAVAAAASQGPVFNQYNTSPEALNPIEVYRQTNNLFTYAADKVTPTAA